MKPLEYFKEKGEVYKVDLIENLPEDEEISFYKLGEFTRFMCWTSFIGY